MLQIMEPNWESALLSGEAWSDKVLARDDRMCQPPVQSWLSPTDHAITRPKSMPLRNLTFDSETHNSQLCTNYMNWTYVSDMRCWKPHRLWLRLSKNVMTSAHLNC